MFFLKREREKKEKEGNIFYFQVVICHKERLITWCKCVVYCLHSFIWACRHRRNEIPSKFEIAEFTFSVLLPDPNKMGNIWKLWHDFGFSVLTRNFF